MDASGEMQGSIHVGLMAQIDQRVQETGCLSIPNAFFVLLIIHSAWGGFLV